MEGKRYLIGTTWGCSMDGPYENCSIGYVTKENEKYVDFGFVGRGGDEGADFFIANSLEEAIVSAHFNPYFIRFYELDEEDLALKDKILKNYKWDNVQGLIKNENPTYEELYEHWLKTKDKAKKKCDIDQLPGQTDLFDIIDKENKND